MSRRAKNRNGQTFWEIDERWSSEPFPTVTIPPFLSKAEIRLPTFNQNMFNPISIMNWDIFYGICCKMQVVGVTPLPPPLHTDLKIITIRLETGVTRNMQNYFWQASKHMC